MYYLILSAVSLALFYLFYKWLLSRDTLHRFNRVVLLVVLVLSVVLPAVHLDLGTRAADFAQMLEELVVTPNDEAYPFKRLNYNVAGEIALSAGMAVLTTVLTGGMFTAYFNPSSPYSAAFTLLVADRDRNTVAYYNSVDGESDPLNRAHVYKLLHRLFKKFPGR